MKGKQLIKKLKAHGVEMIKDRGKGGHQLAKFNGKQTTIPVHGDTDFSKDFIKLICKQLKINPTDIF
jgi:predicted RNA binding protein YcfA (HicA-like mRNA interferase family)